MAHLDEITKPALGDALPCEVGLRARGSDPDRLHAVTFGCVQQHAAPAAPDVEEPHPR